MDFHWLSPRSCKVLVPVTALTLLALFYVERGLEIVPSAVYAEMLQASQKSAEAARHLKQRRLERGVFVDAFNDPAETALIGQEHTQITTDHGTLEAKLASTDPNFAAVVVDMLGELGLATGDCVAVAATGSFPALNLSTLAALETLEIRPVLISSVGASNYGANDPFFTWLDMEYEVARQGLLRTRSRAASLGGGSDSGRGLSPRGRQMLRSAIERNGVPYLAAESLEDSIEQRLALYRAACRPQPIAAYINIGGGVASLGHSLNSNLIPGGASARLPRRNYPARGVLLRLAEEGVPVIQLLNVRRLRQRYGLESVWHEMPLAGQGAVYGELRYSLPRTFAVALLIILGLIGLFVFDRRTHRLGEKSPREREEDTASDSKTTLGAAASALILAMVLCGETVSAQSTVPIFVSGQDRVYEALSAEMPTVITVRGPGELRLVSRARFDVRAGSELRYSLRVRVNGGVEQEVVYESVERSQTAMFRDADLGIPGRLVEYKLRLRRGYHNVEILPAEADPQIFFRYLFKPQRERRRHWVSLTPLGSPEQVELISREVIVPYYRNASGEPFQLEVIGPTELRVFTRIENTPEMRGRIHYRLQVREGEQVINTFQLSSRRSEVAVYRAIDHLVPGQAAEIVVPVPPGRHQLQILPLDPDKSTLLARFMLPREDLGLTAE